MARSQVQNKLWGFTVIHKLTFGFLWVQRELQVTPIMDKFQLVPERSPWWQHLCDNTFKKGEKLLWMGWEQVTGTALQVAAPELLVLQTPLGFGFAPRGVEVQEELLRAAPGVKGAAGCCHCPFGIPRV